MLQLTERFASAAVNRSSATWLRSQCCRSMANCADTMHTGDRVLLQLKGKGVFMTKKLNPKSTTTFQTSSVKHAEIIGKKSRDTVESSRGHDIRAYLPSLAEYVTLTPRMVTPIYPADANFIVSLLDINVDSYRPSPGEPPLEILEGGTGHGSLTLHLARAIHAANPPADKDLYLQIPSASEGGPIEPPKKLQRQAIVHTVDVSEQHSEHARQTVSGFRRGLYTHDIDFHIGDVSEWIDHQFIARGLDAKERVTDKTFLSHIILDMPSAHDHIEKAALALHVNGGLLVFNPNITQIMTVVALVKAKYLPLQLDRVVELGPHMTGGKEWDVRSVKPRARIQAEQEEAARTAQQKSAAFEARRGREATSNGSDSSVPGETRIREPEEVETRSQFGDGWEMVCRPKVGHTVTGGGFVVSFKKMKW